MKFGQDVNGAQKMNPTDFGDSLISYQAPAADQRFHSSSDVSQNLQDGLAQNFVNIYGC